MDKNNINNRSSTDSYFFQVHPNFFKVEYAFAKILKSNTAYRLAIYKGSQRTDQMSKSIKAQVVRGKILFQQNVLNFYLPIYSPARNIQFWLKVYETKHNQKETQIATHRIPFGDCITKFRQTGVSQTTQIVSLVEDFTLNFDIFVHSSKIQLEKIIKQRKAKLLNQNRANVVSNKVRTPKNNIVQSQTVSVNKQDSQTNSHQNLPAVAKIISRKRKIVRQIKSKHGSLQKNPGLQIEDQVQDYKNKATNLNEENPNNARYISPNKPFTPQADQELKYFPKVTPVQTKTKNLVSVSRKDSHSSQVGETFPLSPQHKLFLSKAQSSIQQSDFIRYQKEAKKLEDSIQFQRPTKRNTLVKKQPTLETFQEVEPNQQSTPINLSSINNICDSNIQYNENQLPQQSIIKKLFDKQRKNSYKSPQLALKENQEFNIENHNFSISMNRVPVVYKSGSFLTANKLTTGKLSKSQLNDWGPQNIQKEYELLKNQIFYVIFFVISTLLFYNALIPSRKV